MLLTHLNIRNFKAIHNLNLTLEPGFNLLVGENGTGKTSILEAIAVGLGGFLTGIPQVKTRHFSQTEIRREFFRMGQGSVTSKIFLPLEVELEAYFETGDVFIWKRARTSEKESRTTTQPRRILHYANEISNVPYSNLPVIVYESTARLWYQSRESKKNLFSDKIDRTEGYKDSLKEAASKKTLINWCVKMELGSLRSHREITEYEAVMKLVSDFMSSMNDEKPCRFYFDPQLWDIMYEIDGVDMPVSSLSAGYQSLIWMAFDIAYRMALLNPHMGWKIGLTRGVVLIDEIDMHLHPKWQWKIIDSLTKVFPNIQFIATTHAPIVIVSSKNTNIIDISNATLNEKSISRKSEYGTDINFAVKDYLNSSSLPPIIEKDYNDFLDYLDRNDLLNAETIAEKLEKELGDNNPLSVKIKARLALEKINWED